MCSQFQITLSATKTVHRIMSQVVTLKWVIIRGHPEDEALELRLPWYIGARKVKLRQRE